MQSAILEATSQCFVDIGYANTTMEKIAKQAGASLGAVMHHFKSRAEVIKATASYVAEKRAIEYDQLVANLPERGENGSLVTLEGMRLTVALLVRYYSRPSFVALHELLVAARTDKKLRDVLLPLEKKLDRRISASMRAQFPFLKAIEETREILQDVTQFSLQGLTVSPEPYLGKKRLKNMSEFLARMAMNEIMAAYESSQQAGLAAALQPRPERASGGRDLS